MKRLSLIFLLYAIGNLAFSQTRINLGGGYFGETGTYPGVVAEFEIEKFQSEKYSTPFRANIGYYSHPRSHNAIFLEALYGTRRYFNSGFFIEHALGLGVMFSFYPEDVWHVNDDGTIVRVSNWANPDILPSLTFGAGYNFGKGTDKNNLIWARPKISWQMPYNNLAQPHIALQVGFTHTIKSR